MKAYLTTLYPELTIPSISKLRGLMINNFHLNYIRVPPANARYEDPSFDEKRAWISRILANLFVDNYVIVSLDESSFKSSVGHNYRWRFDTNKHWK
jgi:hypothetical protein